MQNRYVGDIGDFGKYGLLRKVTKHFRHPLAVNWYLTYPEDNRDGGERARAYLTNATPHNCFRDCDPQLYDYLQQVNVDRDKLHVELIEQSGLFPKSTTYYSEELDFRHLTASFPKQLAVKANARRSWHRSFIDRLVSIDQERPIAFLDPDNGLAMSEDLCAHNERARKFVLLDELVDLLQEGADVILYQHAGRKGTVEEQVQRAVAAVSGHVTGSHALALRWNRLSVRSYLIFTTDSESEWPVFVESFLKSSWRSHFRAIAP